MLYNNNNHLFYIAAIQRLRPLRPPPTFIHIHTSRGEVAVHVFMMVGETGVPGVNPRRHKENMQTSHKGPGKTGTTGIRTQGLLAVRRKCYRNVPLS